MYSKFVILRIGEVQNIEAQVECLFLEDNGSVEREIRRGVRRHGLVGGLAVILANPVHQGPAVRPEMLRAGRIQPEARLNDRTVVVLDTVIDARIQGVIGDIDTGRPL